MNNTQTFIYHLSDLLDELENNAHNHNEHLILASRAKIDNYIQSFEHIEKKRLISHRTSI